MHFSKIALRDFSRNFLDLFSRISLKDFPRNVSIRDYLQNFLRIFSKKLLKDFFRNFLEIFSSDTLITFPESQSFTSHEFDPSVNLKICNDCSRSSSKGFSTKCKGISYKNTWNQLILKMSYVFLR